jgi:carboxymethylenebutenolidase
MSAATSALVTLELPYFRARPLSGPPRGGVVLFHEGGGINPQLIRLAERLAHLGYVTAAPDFYHWIGGSGSAEMYALPRPMEPGPTERTLADINTAAAFVRAAGAEKVAMIGFCAGGRWAYRTALNSDQFQASVGFYSVGIEKELGTPRCPTLLLFGGRDEYVSPDALGKIKAHHPDAVVYPQSQHQFFNESSEKYDAAAAADAWRRVTRILSAEIG